MLSHDAEKDSLSLSFSSAAYKRTKNNNKHRAMLEWSVALSFSTLYVIVYFHFAWRAAAALVAVAYSVHTTNNIIIWQRRRRRVKTFQEQFLSGWEWCVFFIRLGNNTANEHKKKKTTNAQIIDVS